MAEKNKILETLTVFPLTRLSEGLLI